MKPWTELPSDCENPRTPILVNRSERRFFHVGCNKWKCHGCKRRKAKTVQKRMLLMRPTHMLTFSLRRAATADDLPELHEKRKSFFQYLSVRRHPRWGMEKHGWTPETGMKNGQLHMHCLVRMRSRFLPYKRIQAAAARIGLGVPDFEPIWRPQQAAAYVAKYITKNLESDNPTSRRQVDHGSTVPELRQPAAIRVQTPSEHLPDSADCDREPATMPRLRRRAARRFGMSIGLTLPPNPAWELATRADDLPVPWSPLILVLAAPMYAIPSG